MEIGDGCCIGPHVYVAGQTRIGRNNVLHPAAWSEGRPRDRSYRGRSGPPGDSGTATSSGSMRPSTPRPGKGGRWWVLGACSWPGAMWGTTAGWGDGAVLGGNASVHQWVRIGRLAMLQGLTAMSPGPAPPPDGLQCQRAGRSQPGGAAGGPACPRRSAARSSASTGCSSGGPAPSPEPWRRPRGRPPLRRAGS